MERIFWAKCSVVMDDFPLKCYGIARENFGNESIYKLVMFVDVRVALHEHPGDHEGPTNESTRFTSSFHTDLRICRQVFYNQGRGRTRKGSDSSNLEW